MHETIIVDASNLVTGGGVTHLRELISAAQPEQHGFSRVIIYAKRRILDQLPERSWLRRESDPLLEGSLLQRIRWQRRVFERRLRENPDAILWVPGGSYLGSKAPFVTMMRNLLPFDRPERQRVGWSKNRIRLKLLGLIQSRTFRRASGIIFLSEFSRRKTVECLGVLNASTVVIPHGIGKQFLQRPRPQRDLSEVSAANPFRLLYVSPIDVYKHAWHVAEAVSQLRRKNIPVQIDFVGPVARLARRRFEEAVDRFDPERKFLFARGAIPYEDMAAIYRDAEVFVFASSCETFGNILLEAMGAGLPIACSNRSAMPEILGDAGVYFDPEKPQEISDALLSLIQSRQERESYGEKAYLRAAAYSWDKCAEKTFSFLRACATPPQR